VFILREILARHSNTRLLNPVNVSWCQSLEALQ
jgi:hypothetical protein